MSEFNLTPTNTLLSSGFDILKMDNIQAPLLDINSLGAVDLEESYFAQAIKFINELSTEYVDNKIVLYKSIAESTDIIAVHESFSDFFSQFKAIIDKVIKFIKSLFQRFLTNLNRLIQSDSYLRKHKDEFNQFKAGDNFMMNGYDFTFSYNIPVRDAMLTWCTDLFKEINETGKGVLTADYIKGQTTAVIDSKEGLYDSKRAEVIGNPRGATSISYTDYSEELFRVYRNDELDTEEIEVDSSVVNKCKNRFFEYKKTISEVEKQRKDIEKAYRDLEKQVRDILSNKNLTKDAFLSRMPGADMFGDEGRDIGSDAFDSGTSGFMAADYFAKMDNYFKAKIDIIQEYSNIHTLAFSAKLDALKDCARQDRATLYTALSRIQRTDKKREV